MSRLFLEAGIIAMAAFISPLAGDRERIRKMFAPGEFLEIYCDCPLQVCEERDVKGMYKRARAGEIPEFTGISAPYEPPAHPELTVCTARQSLEECVEEVLQLLSTAIKLPPASGG